MPRKVLQTALDSNLDTNTRSPLVCAVADILDKLKKGDKQVPLEILRRSKNNVEDNINLCVPLLESLKDVRVLFLHFPFPLADASNISLSLYL